MGGELETVTLTNGRVVRVNARDKERYARKGLIAGQAAPAEAETAPQAVSIPRKKAVKRSENKAVKPADDKGQE